MKGDEPMLLGPPGLKTASTSGKHDQFSLLPAGLALHHSIRHCLRNQDKEVFGVVPTMCLT